MPYRGQDKGIISLSSKEILPYPEGPEPWLQQEKEPDLWYERFKIFRDMGPSRTLPDLARKVEEQSRGISSKSYSPRTLTYLHNATKKYWWRERARAYDEHLEQIELRETAEIRKRVVASQYEMVERFTGLTLERIKSMSPDEFEEAKDVIKAFETAIKTGSLVIGLPTERTESSSVQFTINMGDRDISDNDEGDNNDDRHGKIIDIE